MALTGWPASTDDDGSGQTGTILNESFFDAIEAAIEDYIVSPTNPGVTPAELVDEVVAARGSKVDLDARLDVALNEDGTLKAIAGAVTQANVQTFIGARNVVENGDFEDWLGGAAAAPSSWTLAGAGATVARTGAGEADTFTFGTTQYTAKLTRSGADADLSQDIVAAADFANFVNLKNQKVTISAKVKSGVASQARLRIDDGITQTNSSFHTGGGAEEHLSVVHTISGSATKLTVLLQVLTTDGAVYFGGVQVVFAEFALSDWQPKSQPPAASATRRGVVDVGAQEFEGAKTFREPITFHAGASATGAVASGRIHSNTTPVGNVGASGPDTLMSFSLPAGVLDEDGKALRVVMWGNTAANANNKAWQVLFGVGTPITARTVAHNGESWAIIGTIIRVSNTTVETFWELRSAAASGVAVADHDIQRASIGGLNLDGAATTIAVQTTVSTADNDIVQNGMLVEVLG